MLELEIILDWVCCECGRSRGATLRCEGEGLADKDAKALAKVPCPECHAINQVVFSPDEGAVYHVLPEEDIVRWRIPVPSYN
jgi:hypothetical protein